MEFDRENPSPLTRLPGGAEAHWHEWSPELETAYLQQLAGVENLEDATSLQLVVNTAAGGSIAHLGATLANLVELNLNGSTLDSLRDLGTGFRQLQVLWVSRCGLKALDGLNGLPALRELYAAYNDIADLQPVDSCLQLEVLDMECNCIHDTDAVLYLGSCSHLQALTLAGNPAADQPDYRRAVCSALPSLQVLDDEPVTAADRAPGEAQSTHQQQQHLMHHQAHQRAGSSGSAGGRSSPAAAAEPLPPPPLKAAAAAVSASAAPGGCTAGTDVALTSGCRAQPDPDEVAFVVAGIKHARVGVDSHEFREIEMNLLVATADGTDVQLDSRPGTSTLLPASAGTWVRTLRSSREGSLAALRATHLAAAAAASSSARTGSQSPASPCSGSPISSRPPSSQQQRTSAMSAPSTGAHQERWATPAGAGGTLGLSSSFGAAATAGGGGMAGTWRPGSGTGVGLLGGGAGGGIGESPARPGSGEFRPGTGRPFSARPGTAASFSARLGTSASTGAAPVASAAGLYWAKNRISGGSGGASGGGGGGGGGGEGAGGGASRAVASDEDGVASSSKLTQGTESTFGGSFARDLRKWKGAAVRAAASTSSGSGSGAAAAGGGGARPTNGVTVPTAAVMGGGQGLSHTLLRGGQLDPKALLEELKRWKLETADKVLFVDPDESGSGDTGWAGADAPEGSSALLSNGGGTGSDGHKADILRLSTSQDGAGPDAGPLGLALGMGLALLDPQGPEPAFSPAIPGSPLQPPRPPPGAAAAGRRKMVLAKVLRDIAADSIGGASISEILAGLRPVHAPAPYPGAGGGGGVFHGPSVAWGAPPEPAVAPSSGHGSGNAASRQQGGAGYQSHGSSSHRPGSARSVCSSSGQSDFGASATGQSSRPGSRDEQGGGWVSSGVGSSGGWVGGGSGGTSASGTGLQRQKSVTRAPGLPVGPSAPVGPGSYRVASVAGEMDVRSSNPSPTVRYGNW